MKNLIITVLFAVSVTSPCAQSCSNLRYVDSLFDVTTTYNVEYQQAKPYGSLINLPYHLDIYQPASDTLAYRPLVIFQFGGGYLIGDKLNPPANAYCSYWAQHGYVCVSINYRLGFNTLLSGSAERAVYRAVQDLQAALRFLVDERTTYGIDTSNIIVSGNSAGAISTMHSAYMDVDQVPASVSGFGFGLDSDDLGDPFSSGNTNFGNQEVMADGLIACWGGMLDTNLVGDRTDDYVPIILFHGEDDTAVMYTSGHPFSYPAFPILYGSLPLKTRMDNQGITSKLVPFPGAGHEPELLNPAYLDTILDESSKFMYQEVLKPIITGVSGETMPFLNSTEVYTVSANDPISELCVTSSTGTVVGQSGNQVTVEWPIAGPDTLRIIAVNHILANDTTVLPIEVSASTSLEERLITNSSIYPNPGNGIAFLDNPNGSTTTVTVYAADGKLIKEITSSAKKIEIDIRSFPSGMYLIRKSNQESNPDQQLFISN